MWCRAHGCETCRTQSAYQRGGDAGEPPASMFWLPGGGTAVLACMTGGGPTPSWRGLRADMAARTPAAALAPAHDRALARTGAGGVARRSVF
eukprot:scaffold571_cov364-Prasinococcus_capsulatus_cf.AAC.11